MTSSSEAAAGSTSRGSARSSTKSGRPARSDRASAPITVPTLPVHDTTTSASRIAVECGHLERPAADPGSQSLGVL